MKKEKQLTQIKNEIKSNYLKHEESLFESTKYAWKLGKILNKAKEFSIKNGEQWGKFRTKHFSYIEKRKAQRFMKLARDIDMSKYRFLALIPFSDLEKFIAQCKKNDEPFEKKLDKLSNFNKIKKVPNDYQEISKIKEGFKKIIEELNPSQAGVKNINAMDRYKKERGKKKTNPTSTKLISTTNRTANKLLENLTLLHKEQPKINSSKDDGLDYKTIKKLSKLIKQFLKIHQ